MSDRLAELFANKPISYTGAGLTYSGDASGHGVTQPEQGLVIKRNVTDAVSTATSNSYPFKCPNSTDGSTASDIVAGSVNGITATNLSLTISNSGTKYVYVDVTYTQNVSGAGYVTGISGSVTCALATGASVPSNTSTHLYRMIATYVNGTKTVQAVVTSLEVVVRGTNSSGSFDTLWGTS